jgi:Mannosyltransferase (PIG-V)
MDSQAMAQTAATPSIGYRTKPALRSPKVRWRTWAGIVGLALVVKILIVLAALVASGRTADPATTILLQWRQWDASHYLYLAGHGYATTGDPRNLIAFFPLYPAAIALLGLAGVPLAVAALAISNAGSLVAAVLLYEIARLDSDEAAAFRAAALFVLFPTAYFLFNGYSEGLFCALAFGSVLAARYGRWLPAGGLGALAAASRVTGIALFPFLLVELATVPLAQSHRRRALAGAALVPLGLLSYLAVNWWVLHDALAFVDVQRRHWFHWLSTPWTGAIEATRWFANRDPWLRLTVGAGELLGAAVAYAISLLSWVRLRPSDATYALVVTVLVTFLPFWLSIPRYLLALYPLFVLAGRVRAGWVQGVVAVSSLSALVVLSVAFTRGQWAF